MARDRETKAARDLFLTNRWTSVFLPAAVRAKKRFQKDTDEVDSYFRSDHDHLYNEVSKLLPRDSLLTLTINLAAQVRGYMGPHLYARHPVRTVTAATKNSVTRWYAKVADVYLNAVPYEVDLKEEIRSSIDDALLPGRGVGMVTKDKIRDVITTVQVPVDDLLIDPDARCLEDAQWIAIRKIEPLWLVKKRYKTGGEDDPTKGLKANALSWMEDKAGVDKESGKLLDLGDTRYKGKTSELCTYFEIWTKFGTGLLHGKGNASERGSKPAFDVAHEGGDRYRYMVVVPGHDKPLTEGDWPIPMHLDDDWPIGLLDFTPTRKGDKKDPLWPVSLMKLGLSHQKAIDLLCTIVLNDAKFKARTVAGVLGDKAEEIKEALTGGDMHVAIALDPQDGVQDIRQIFQIMDLGTVDPSLVAQIDWHERKFGEITGLNPILKGQAGQVEAQVRSATEASMRDKNSRSRLEDMNERVEAFNGKAARREFLAIRLSCEPDEVERVVQDKLPAAPWKAKVSIGADPLTVSEVKEMWPAAGEYFPDQKSAEAAVQQLLTEAKPMIEQGWQAQNPGHPFLFMAKAVEVDLEELWFDTAGADAESLAREYSVKVEAGSARRQDWDLKQDQNAFLVSEVGARSAALGDYNTYNKILNRVQESLQIPPSDRVFMDVEFIQQAQQAAQQAEDKKDGQKLQVDLQKVQLKAQADIAKQDRKGMTDMQEQMMDGQLKVGMQGLQHRHEKTLDKVGGGGSR